MPFGMNRPISAPKKAIYTTLRRMSSLRLSLVLLLGSCATADGNGDGGQPPAPDARKNAAFPDAAPLPDSGPLPDAVIQVDAAPDSPDAGAFCTTNSDCIVPGECCHVLDLDLECKPGTVIGGVCVSL